MNMVFPLPLTQFEKYMLWDDRPKYPMAFVIQVLLSGEARREAFEAAFEETLARHPMLSALVDPTPRNGPCWVPSQGETPLLDWNQEGVPLECPGGGGFDLARQPGLRTWVRQGPGRVEITLQVHHACCDGLGLLQVIGDLLAAYGIRTACDGERPLLEPLDLSQLARRGVYTVEAPETVGRWQIIRGTVREAWKWVGRSPTPLCSPQGRNASTGPPSPPPFPGMLAHHFDREQSQRLRSAARRNGASLNDLLLRDLFVTCARWNEQCRPGRPGRWLRINMPQNLRDRSHEHMPAANVMTQAFITRHAAACAAPDSLLDDIRKETELVKRWRLGLYFLGGLGIAERVPGLLPLGRALLGNRCLATTVLTYVGEFSRRFTARLPRRAGRTVAGNLVVERLVGIPPIRPGTRAGFGVPIYNGEVTVTVRADPVEFRLDDTERLLQLYVEQLTHSMEKAD